MKEAGAKGRLRPVGCVYIALLTELHAANESTERGRVNVSCAFRDGGSSTCHFLSLSSVELTGQRNTPGRQRLQVQGHPGQWREANLKYVIIC